MWLGTRAELEPERQAMEQAMADSLREAESVKPSAPLEEQKTPELLQLFKSSVVLTQVRHSCAPCLFQGVIPATLNPSHSLHRHASPRTVTECGSPLLSLL